MICHLHRNQRARTSNRRRIIGYLKFYVGISPYYYIAAAVMFVGVLLIARRLPLVCRIGMSLLIPYLFLMLTATVFVRTPTETANILLEPFRTYRQYAESDFWQFQIQANILLFIPVGFLLSMVMNRVKFLPIIIGTLFSVAIEIIQLLTHRGTFEIDDLISNFFGILIGYIIFLPFRMLIQMDEENKNLQEQKNE